MMDTPPVCDYEGSDYRDRFWESKPRNYEDRTERIALRRLLPPRGRRVVHLGAGFGRMTRELDGYDQVIVLDYSRTMLRDAQVRLGKDGRFVDRPVERTGWETGGSSGPLASVPAAWGKTASLPPGAGEPGGRDAGQKTNQAAANSTAKDKSPSQGRWSRPWG